MTLILNLGCGSTTSDRCTNIDWSPYARIASSRFLKLLISPFMDKVRRKKLASIDGKIKCWDLRKGIPFSDGQVDAIYHSNFLEHIDRDAVPAFLREVTRALKPGGVHRIVVPDLELLTRRYLESLEAEEMASHDDKVADILEQCVRREAAGSKTKAPLRRTIENFLLGDARKRGETHNWMYDRLNIKALLIESGFKEVQIMQPGNSCISDDWSSLGLDTLADGSARKKHCLYIEAIRP